MTNKYLPTLFALLLILTIVSPSPAQQPCTAPSPGAAGNEPNIFSDEQEIHLGDAIAEYIQKDYKVIDDPEVTAYRRLCVEHLCRGRFCDPD